MPRVARPIKGGCQGSNSIRTLPSLRAGLGRKRSTFCPLARPSASSLSLLFAPFLRCREPTAVISPLPRRNAALTDTLLSIPIRATATVGRSSNPPIEMVEMVYLSNRTSRKSRRTARPRRRSSNGGGEAEGEGLEEGRRRKRAEVEEDRNKLGTSRLPTGVLPEMSPGDLQGEDLPAQSWHAVGSIVYVTSRYPAVRCTRAVGGETAERQTCRVIIA